MLGRLVVPVLRREFAIGRPAGVPEAPVHPRVQALLEDLEPAPVAAPVAEAPAR